MADTKKFVVTTRDQLPQEVCDVFRQDGRSEIGFPVNETMDKGTGFPEDMEQKGEKISRFSTERARMDSTSSNFSTDDEQDPNVKAVEDPSYIDSITSTSSSTSAKPLLASVKELEGVQEEELEDRLARTNTMKGLLENPSYVDSLTISSPDHRRLARACRKALALRQQQQAKREKSLAKYLSGEEKLNDRELATIPEHGQVKKGTYIRNVVLLSIGGMLSYTAFLSLRNLQSSLNHQKGVGLISLAGGYGMFMLGSLISPFVVKALRPKRAILLAIAMQIVYVAMNVYPTFYTLLPSTMVVGLCNASLWVAVNTYITYLATDYSKLSGKSLGTIMSTFFGIYFMIFQLNNIFGNLLSSVILFSGQGWKEISTMGFVNGTMEYETNVTSLGVVDISINNDSARSSYFSGDVAFLDTTNASLLKYEANDTSSFIFSPRLHCGANHCHSFPIDQAGGNKVTDILRYSLIGAFGAFGILGFATIFFFVEALKTYKTKVELAAAFKEVKSVFSLITEGKFLLLLPIQVYMGLEMAFLPGDVLKAFVTCPIGIQMVGYVMMGYGASTAMSSYAAGRLHRVVGKLVLICSAGMINLGIFISLYLMETPEGESLPIVLMVVAWGVADGIWNTQVNSCVATMFVKKSEQALAGNRFVSGFGVTLAYAYAPLFCMKTKLIVTGALAIVGVLCFVILDVVERRRSSVTFKVTQV